LKLRVDGTVLEKELPKMDLLFCILDNADDGPVRRDGVKGKGKTIPVQAMETLRVAKLRLPHF
jgi:hypothetical protein